jgi:hypothetical protein
VVSHSAFPCFTLLDNSFFSIILDDEKEREGKEEQTKMSPKILCTGKLGLAWGKSTL